MQVNAGAAPVLEINPERLYFEADVIQEFGFSYARLKHAREAEGLRWESREKGGGKRVYFGRWLLAWLEREKEGARGEAN